MQKVQRVTINHGFVLTSGEFSDDRCMFVEQRRKSSIVSRRDLSDSGGCDISREVL